MKKGRKLAPPPKPTGNTPPPAGLESFLDQMPEVFYRVSIEDDPLRGSVEYVSPQGAKVTGLTEKEFKKDPTIWMRSIHPDDLESVQRSTSEILLSKAEGRRSYRILNKATQEYVWIDDIVMPLIDPSGTVTGYQGVARDVTEQMHARTAIEESEARHRVMFTHAPDVMIIVDAEGRVLDINDPATRATGYPRTDIVGRHFAELGFLAKEDLPRYASLLEDMLHGRPARRLEVKYVPRTGGSRWVEIRVANVSGTGTAPRFLVVARDLTDRKEAELRLLESEESFRRAFEFTPIGMAIVAPDDTLLRVNEALCTMLGYTSEELTGMHITEITHPEDKDSEDVLKKPLRDGEEDYFKMEKRYIRKDGSILWGQLSVSVVPGPDGQPVYFIGQLEDITARKQAEEVLIQREEQFRAIFENSPVGIGVARMDGTLLAYNEAMRRPGSYTHEDIQRIKNVAGLYYDPEERTAVLATFASEGRVRDYPVRFRRKDGTPYDAILSLIPTTFEGERCVQAMVLDVTEQKAAQERLLQLQQAVDSSDEIVFMTNPDGIITYVNPAFTKYYKYSFASVVGRSTPRILKSGQHSAAWYHNFWETIRNADPYRGEIVNKAEDGSIIHVEAAINPVIDETGTTVGYLAIQRNINERKRTDQALRESEEKYRSLFEESKDAILLTTLDGHISDINQAGLDLFGYSSLEDIRKVDIGQELYVDPANRAVFVDLMARQGFVENHESEVRRRDGSSLIVNETTTPIRDHEGVITGYRAILRDITHQKELEDQLRQAQKMESLGTLAGGIAHDFNNILGIILAHSSHIPNVKGDERQIEQSLQAIQKASQRGAGLVKQLLTFARKSETKYALVDINAIIREITKLIKETFPRTILLEVELDDDLPALYGDPSQLHQVILNLCVNARDAMQKGGTLTIKTEYTPPEVFTSKTDVDRPSSLHIRLMDTGVGMSAGVRERIFEPFFTTKESGKGTGLGLALVYGIIKSHKGLITVDSEPEKGTRFDIYFPVKEDGREEVASESDSTHTPEGGEETILVVEDEDMLLDLLAGILAGNGYTVLTAADGKEAVEIFQKNHDRINLVLTDLGLPKLSGEDVVRRIREIDGTSKVIVASGYIEPEARRRLEDLGLASIIDKPYQAREVLQSIRSCLD